MGSSSTKAKRKYNDKAYDQINLIVPKGKKAELQELADRLELSLNGLIKNAIEEYEKSHKID